MIRIAVLLSGKHGRGSNMAALADACASGHVDGQVVCVVGNYNQSPALARARALGLNVSVVPSPAPGADETVYANALLPVLTGANVDLICLAGFVRRVPLSIVQAFAGRILNTHPALLPAFGGQGMYGERVHRAVLEYGAKVSGCTVHFVDEAYDTGPVIMQEVVPVAEDDTPDSLAARVLEAEHRAYPEAVRLFAQGRLSVEGRRVRVKR